MGNQMSGKGRQVWQGDFSINSCPKDLKSCSADMPVHSPNLVSRDEYVDSRVFTSEDPTIPYLPGSGYAALQEINSHFYYMMNYGCLDGAPFQWIYQRSPLNI